MSSNQKNNKYEAQTRYHASHYYKVTISIPLEKKSVLDSIAKENGISFAGLIKNAIRQTYGVDCSIGK